jgi:hypothetical protein
VAGHHTYFLSLGCELRGDAQILFAVVAKHQVASRCQCWAAWRRAAAAKKLAGAHLWHDTSNALVMAATRAIHVVANERCFANETLTHSSYFVSRLTNNEQPQQ